MQAEDFYRELGQRMQAARKALGITQEGLATMFDLTRASIANMEQGRQRAPLHTVVRMAGMLGFEIPAVERGPAAEQLLLHATQHLKEDRDRLNECLETIMQIAHDGRFPPRTQNNAPAPKGGAGGVG